MAKRRNKSVVFFMAVLFLLTSIVAFQVYNTISRRIEKEKELAQLQQELSQEMERTKALEEELKYINTDEYIIERAREDLNLILEGEKVYIKTDD
ncbi:MAG: septum formation initiator family protein [Vallitaleaceae bacterium]|nr:septum formation initiator family protein [Vallitaleaceae bacterium]